MVLDRPGWHWLRSHPVGLVLGTAFVVLATTPSLLPRDWLSQGVVSGISAAAGYGVGVVLSWLLGRSTRWRRLRDRSSRALPRGVPSWVWAVLLLAVPVALVIALLGSAEWQQDIALLVGIDQTTTTGWLRAGPVLILIAGLLLAPARGIRRLHRLGGARTGPLGEAAAPSGIGCGCAARGGAARTVVTPQQGGGHPGQPTRLRPTGHPADTARTPAPATTR